MTAIHPVVGWLCVSVSCRGRLQRVHPTRERACTTAPSLPDPRCFCHSTPGGGRRSSPPAHPSRQAGRTPHPPPDGARLWPFPARRCKCGSSLHSRSGYACSVLTLTLVSESPDGGEDLPEDIYATVDHMVEPSLRTSQNSVKAKFSLPHQPAPERHLMYDG